MSDAPERIWAWHSMRENDLLSGMWRNWDAPVASDAVTYIRADHVDALLKAEREKALREAARYLQSLCGCSQVTCASEDDCNMDRQRARDILALISKDETDG